MEKLISKNVLIGLLLLTNVASAMVVLKDQIGLPRAIRSYFHTKPSPKTVAQKAERAKIRAQVEVPNPLARENSEIQKCYEAFLQSDPKVAEGEMLVHWLVDDQGRIAKIDLIKSELPSDEFSSCVVDKVKSMTFKPSARPEGTMVAHTFRFHRRELSAVAF